MVVLFVLPALLLPPSVSQSHDDALAALCDAEARSGFARKGSLDSETVKLHDWIEANVQHVQVRKFWKEYPTGAELRAFAAEHGIKECKLAELIEWAYALAHPTPAQGADVGSMAPDFTLRAVGDKYVTLSALRPRFVVLVFYRGHW